MRLEHGRDRGAEPLSLLEVALDKIDVWVDDSKLAVGQAAEQVAGAGRRRKQEWSQDHRVATRYDAP
jgi:hypothetical protein